MTVHERRERTPVAIEYAPDERVIGHRRGLIPARREQRHRSGSESRSFGSLRTTRLKMTASADDHEADASIEFIVDGWRSGRRHPLFAVDPHIHMVRARLEGEHDHPGIVAFARERNGFPGIEVTGQFDDAR